MEGTEILRRVKMRKLYIHFNLTFQISLILQTKQSPPGKRHQKVKHICSFVTFLSHHHRLMSEISVDVAKRQCKPSNHQAIKQCIKPFTSQPLNIHPSIHPTIPIEVSIHTLPANHKSIHPSIHIPIHHPATIHPPINQPTKPAPTIHLYIYLSIVHPPIHPSTKPTNHKASMHPSIHLSMTNRLPKLLLVTPPTCKLNKFPCIILTNRFFFLYRWYLRGNNRRGDCYSTVDWTACFCPF